jgi:hypothetical protein
MKIVDTKPHKSVVERKVCNNCGVTLEYVPKDVVIRSYGKSESDPFIKCPNCENWIAV